MKNYSPPAYTAREIVEILKEAKAMGWTDIVVENGRLEARMRVPVAAVGGPAPQATPPPTSPRQTASYDQVQNEFGVCSICHNPKIMGKWGKPYCVECHIARKERIAAERLAGQGRRY